MTIRVALLVILLSLPGGPFLRAQAEPDVDPDRWLEEVGYIISSREREEFRSLMSPAERLAFAERFWRRRDPDPSTEANEFRREFYRRMEYANRHFSAGRPGWKTDRGRIYILHGEPDQRLVFPSLRLSSFDPSQLTGTGQPTSQPTGLTQTVDVPEAELWTYRYLPGQETLRGPVDIFFMKVSSADVAALANLRQMTAGAGGRQVLDRRRLALTSSLYGGSGSAARDFQIVYVGSPRFQDPQDFYTQLEQNPLSFDPAVFTKNWTEVTRSPGDLLEEKERRWRRYKEEVQATVFFAQLETHLDYWFLRSSSGFVYIPLSLHVEGASLEGTRELVVMVEMLRNGEVVARVFDELVLDPASTPSLRFEGLQYQTRLAVRPGLHRMEVYVLDRANGRYRHLEKTIRVPDLSQPGFSLSDLILCRRVETLERARRQLPFRHQLEWLTFGDWNPLRADDYLLVPAPDSRFRRKDLLTVFLEVYDPALKGDRPQVGALFRLMQGDRVLAVSQEKKLDYITQGDLLKTSYAVGFPLASLPPGDYRLEVLVRDQVRGELRRKESAFRVE